ncbi:MAG: glutaredoxin family protein [bacterium]
MTKLILYTKPSCHLCDEMKIILRSMKKDLEFDLEEFNIETDERLYEKYKEKIPVLMIDNRIFAKFRLKEEKLRRKLLCNL